MHEALSLQYAAMCKSAALLAAELAGSGACRCTGEKHDIIHTEQKTWCKAQLTCCCACMLLIDDCITVSFDIWCVWVCGHCLTALSLHCGIILHCPDLLIKDGSTTTNNAMLLFACLIGHQITNRTLSHLSYLTFTIFITSGLKVHNDWQETLENHTDAKDKQTPLH